MAPACRALGVARASVYRHRQAPRPPREAAPPPSPRALAPAERAQVLATLHEDRFVDQAPAAVHAILLEEGHYLCSVRTMYRLLHGAGEVRERRRQRHHPRAEPPRLVATAPNQVWTWDITCLAGPRRGGTYPLYVVLDLLSRYVVAWMVATRESAGRARRLIQAACLQQAIEPGQLTLHQDRSAPMTAKSYSQLLVDLDILASCSRPRPPTITRTRRASSKPANTPTPTRAALPTRSKCGPGAARFSSGKTPGIDIADWICSPRSRSIKGAPPPSRPSDRRPRKSLHTPSRTLRQGAAAGASCPGRGPDQPDAQHHRMCTREGHKSLNRSVSFALTRSGA